MKKIIYDSYVHADTLEEFLKFLKDADITQRKALKTEIKALRKAKQIIIHEK